MKRPIAALMVLLTVSSLYATPQDDANQAWTTAKGQENSAKSAWADASAANDPLDDTLNSLKQQRAILNEEMSGEDKTDFDMAMSYASYFQTDGASQLWNGSLTMVVVTNYFKQGDGFYAKKQYGNAESLYDAAGGKASNVQYVFVAAFWEDKLLFDEQVLIMNAILAKYD